MRPPEAYARLARGLVVSTLVVSCGGDSTGASPGSAVATVTVTPPTATVDIGQTTQLTATVRNGRGETVTVAVSWMSSGPAVASVTPSGGVVTGVMAGSATITASAGGRSGSAVVTVHDPSPPGAPSGVLALPVSNTAVDVAWTDNSANEDEFHIEREAVAGAPPSVASGAGAQGFVQAGVVSANVTTFEDTGLDPASGYRYRVLACNENGCSGPSGTSADVSTFETLTIETTALPDGTEHETYEAALQAAGGDGNQAWSVSAGDLPPGLSLGGATGVISGTPSTPGTFDFTVQAEGAGQTVTRDLSIVIQEQILPPIVLTTELPTGVVGGTYTTVLAAGEGDGSYAWQITSGSLPPGLTVAGDGTVAGVPTTPGHFPFTVEVTSAAMTGVADLAIDVFHALSVTTGALPSAVTGIAYHQVLAAAGGDGSYGWAVVEGQLPGGLALAPDGTLSGTPTTVETATFTVQVASGDGQTAQAGLSITVNDEVLPPQVTTTSLPDAGVGAAYSATLQATDGDGSYTWAITAGALPAGLTLGAATGEIAGTPTGDGTSNVTVQVTSAALTGSADLSITVHPMLTVSTSSLPDAVEGQSYSEGLTTAGGSGGGTWSLASGTLPDGLSLGSGGTISGTVAASPPASDPPGPSRVTGTFGFVVRVENALGQSATRSLSITVNAVLAVTTGSLPGGEVGTPYGQTLAASGGDGSNTWSIASGALPDGLGLGATTGEITGTPTAAGTFAFTVQVASGDGQVAQKALSIQIVSGVVTVTTASLPDGEVGTPYDQTLAATGGTGSYTWAVTAGALPDGLTLTGGTGQITGTPTTTGTSNFTVEASSGGQSDDQALSITIAAAPVTIDTDYLVTAYPGAAYSDAVEASGGDGSFTFSVTGGALPDGITLDPGTGALTGNAGTPGAYYFTVTASSAGNMASKTYAVAISTQPAGAFNMGIVNVAGNTIPSAAIVTQLGNVLARWEQVITGDLVDVFYPPGTWSSAVCGGDGPKLNGQAVDDMVILVNLAPIDGAGNVLGSAGPCGIRVNTVPPDMNTVFGRLTLDTDDLIHLDTHQLFSVTFHEIGHIVGIGTLWRAGTIFHAGTDLISDAIADGGTEPKYEGTGGNAVYTGPLGGGSSGTATKIPIEDGGGTGTQDGHWEESEFDAEIMTGWAEPSGVTMPISAMTIAAVGDFAYTVNTAAADAYSIPPCAPLCSPVLPTPPALAAPGVHDIPLNDILDEPLWTMLPNGTVVRVGPPRKP